MAARTVKTDLDVDGTVDATTVTEGGVPVVVSTSIDDIVEISQASYDGLGGGRPAGRLYVITS